MRYGQFLKDEATIGFVAPSFGCNIEPYKSSFDNAQKKFKLMGYSIDLGPNCYEGKGIGISNTPRLCGEELTQYYCSDKNDILLSCGGGELMCETIDYVDFNKIAEAEPKWYMGYSDNTNMTFLLTTLCDTASIYGPCAPAFGMDKWHPAIEDAFLCLKGEKKIMTNYDLWEKESLKDEENPLVPYNVTEKTVIKCFHDNSVSIEGRLLGGCIDCLVNLTGTKYDNVKQFCSKYKEDGIIWFLESCDLNVMSIRRAIWHMSNAGWFDTAKGFIIGRPLVFGQELFGLNHYSAVTDLLQKYNVPIIMDADIGHLAPMMPIVCGSNASVKAEQGKLTVSMNYE